MDGGGGAAAAAAAALANAQEEKRGSIVAPSAGGEVKVAVSSILEQARALARASGPKGTMSVQPVCCAYVAMDRAKFGCARDSPLKRAAILRAEFPSATSLSESATTSAARGPDGAKEVRMHLVFPSQAALYAAVEASKATAYRDRLRLCVRGEHGHCLCGIAESESPFDRLLTLRASGARVWGAGGGRAAGAAADRTLASNVVAACTEIGVELDSVIVSAAVRDGVHRIRIRLHKRSDHEVVARSSITVQGSVIDGASVSPERRAMSPLPPRGPHGRCVPAEIRSRAAVCVGYCCCADGG